jgi:hypothetical protein
MMIKLNSAKEFWKRAALSSVFLFVGWSLAHHFVITMGGTWPDKSIVGYLIEFYDMIGGTVALGIILSLFRNTNRRTGERRRTARRKK